MPSSKIKKIHLLDYSILVPYFVLSLIGLIMVYSSTGSNLIEVGANSMSSVIKQSLFWIVSLFLIFIVYRLKLTFLKNEVVMLIVMLVEGVLLVLTRLFAEVTNGAAGWLYIGSFSIQPAEYLKIILIWFLAFVFSRRQENIAYDGMFALTKGKLKLTDWRVLTSIMILLVAIQPDMGNAVILILITLVMVFASGINYRWAYFTTGIAVVFSIFFIKFVEITNGKFIPRYIYARFNAFTNPFKDLQGDGLQLANSYYAINNGGWFGRGLGNSIEKKGYLPEAHTDFIFSIVIEELGLLGGILILVILIFLILRIIQVGIRSYDPFNSMMAIGIGGMFLIQLFINLGGISGLIPSTGVTFPFLSQGGNNLLVLGVAVAFVLNISASEKKERILYNSGYINNEY
ncbi:MULTISPECIES: FtsW/RodA/SpoVE family cell cycle protein [unclassified Enterococcus]|uniref:FtsW/RodA/SpoVE family cell cycle protein n=1 Tax=unclassified Enterococcus TaxID=2608891 RepID=UPI0015580998|nr:MULTISPECIES: FtsW/RodA/SpoVE family cell cycle protein [unclassified Enterococcus]MBS7577567.1 FtsW/RodA/SpoVE family cell cycle protein [Enterococcus sp. MMGLQ5-2]MBS7584934.1 FtsW/RodA/SpoVE family cell cycle protein [Enterococcus sp. MMGLQ5-1]NPD12789.1 FtsW/RodA/SpoVE family cell cycle protein [Enterococcus sp. MMGLQ5-1]NPD37400.1 FtsW/RodA/SpoVE family cell cycle protein [Enterococcus sp. MMGLQ5-2]